MIWVYRPLAFRALMVPNLPIRSNRSPWATGFFAMPFEMFSLVRSREALIV